jgi:glycosyltransferase involved in cell wall biosynthesis
MPLVSVVVPTHNRPDMLAEALASVRTQTFSEYEIIIVSNGEDSKMRERSHAVAALYGAQYFALKRGNVSVARNFGIDQAKGEWTAFLDDDDIWLPEKLERQLAELERTGADMIACDYVEFDEYGVKPDLISRPGPADVRKLSHLQWWAALPSVVVRTGVLREINFDVSFSSCEDTDLWRRISWRHRIHQMNDVLVRVRRAHPSVTRKRTKALWCEIRLFWKTWRDTPSDLRSAVPSMSVMRRHVAGSFDRIFLTDPWTANPTLRAINVCWTAFRRLVRPRTRLMQLRYRLRLRTRLNELRYRLRLRTRFNQLHRHLRLQTRARTFL